ncbi:MAG: hypothetical protein R6X02_17500 [Enhygromyxa sp.]
MATTAVVGLAAYALTRVVIDAPASRSSAASPASDGSGHRALVVPSARLERAARTVVVREQPFGREPPLFSPLGGGRSGPPDYAPRDPSEWQGMLVNLALQQTGCESSAACGLAMACVDQRCGPCSGDEDCASEEACVLQHCVPTRQVECRRASDCEGEALCVLSGYTAAPRGNEGMRSFCDGPTLDQGEVLARYGRDPGEADGPARDPNEEAGIEAPIDNTAARLLAAVLD